MAIELNKTNLKVPYHKAAKHGGFGAATIKSVLVLFAFVAFKSAVLSAQGSVPPPNKDGPVEVEITLRINKIYGINSIHETYLIDSYLVARWLDPRLRFEPRDSQPEQIMYKSELASLVMEDSIWWPTIEFINIVGARDVTDKQIIIRKDGKVSYKERFHATFTSDMDFRKYPFDTQCFKIQIESFSHEKNEVIFVRPLAQKIEESLIEWELLDQRFFISDELYAFREFETVDEDSATYSRYNMEIEAKRKPGYFIWQLFLPLFLIIAASWIVFWISEFGHQLSVTFTLMLTVVAFNFYTSTLLPRLPYNTFIEVVIISGYVAIFLAIVTIVVGHVSFRKGKEKASKKLMGTCRWLFPVGYVLSMFLLTISFLGWIKKIFS